MPTYKEKYYRKLPHIQPRGHAFFVTFRLKDSISRNQLEELKIDFEEKNSHLIDSNDENDKILLSNARKRHFEEYDDLLNKANNGPTHLANPKIAQVVADKLFELDGTLYDLLCFSIMPNHVHILIHTAIQFPSDFDEATLTHFAHTPLSSIMKRIKGGSSFELTKAKLKTKGVSFWEAESYDHYIRNEGAMDRIAKYILNNPVKARIVQKWEDHPFTYLKDRFWE